nr:UvrD-helicase domain-containing protein [Fodinicola acaciae]
MWKIRENYRAARIAGGHPYDWPGLSTDVRVALASDVEPRRYKHIVVDEGQDFSPEMIRSLAEVIQKDGTLTLFADYAQQIYGQRISWRSCGLAVPKVEYFFENYRNSPEIARLAIAMAQMPHFTDSADLVEPREPRRAAGAMPTLIPCSSREAEKAAVSTAAADFGKVSRVGVFAHTRAERERPSRLSTTYGCYTTMSHWEALNPAFTLAPTTLPRGWSSMSFSFHFAVRRDVPTVTGSKHSGTTRLQVETVGSST